MATLAVSALALTGIVTGSSAASAGSLPTKLTTTATPAVSYAAGNYVVVLRDKAVASYDGKVRGYAATKPKTGAKLDASTTKVKRYKSYLRKRQNATLKSVGAKATYQYTTTLNGFAAHLSAKQATKLAGQRNVLAVTKDVVRKVDSTPNDALSATSTSGYKTNDKTGLAIAKGGKGVVIGVLDTGIWPESASFAAAPLATSRGADAYISGTTASGSTTAFRKSDGTTFTGLCQAGENWAQTDCNQKIISARYYPETFLANVAPEHRAPTESLSTRDGDGHGTHTASTAAGNKVAHAVIDGHDYGSIAGIATNAKIAAYKVCFSDDDEDTGDCYTSDSIAAIEQATLDGVDVINYSISGALTSTVDAVELAFLNAAAAGVFVATSAGNDGPATSTVNHPSPWVTTVAASSDRRHDGTIVLGNGEKYRGVSNNVTAVPSSPLVLASSVAIEGADANEARLCFTGTLDPAKAAGKIVLCDRGVNARVDKGIEVQRVGGVGMILANTSENSLDADIHFVPTVHVDQTVGDAIKAYLAATPDATAALQVGDTTGQAPTVIPQLAGFSSRGPSPASGGDIIKPDITGPGVSVIAAVAPPSNHGRSFDAYSGTSMSSPYIAGLAALYFAVHPKWSPMAVKSAMMTTAYDIKNADGTLNRDPFEQGAGHANLWTYFQPGLVLESDVFDWAEFYAGQGLQLGAPGAEFPALAATDLNQASIAVGSLAGSTTVTRTFTATEKGRYDVHVTVPGFTATASPRKLNFSQKGEKQDVTFTFTRTDAPIGEFATGFVRISGTRFVRLPVALRPVSVAAPAEISGSGASGSTDFTVTPGETGALTTTTTGFTPGNVQSSSLTAGQSGQYIVQVQPGTSFARFNLDAADNTGDLDLYLYALNADGTAITGLAASSATSSADERIDITDPAPGYYLVTIDAFALPAGASSIDFTETDFLVNPATSVGTFSVTPNPATVTQGQPTTLTANWAGLDATAPYLGLIGYGSSEGTHTVVSINS